MIAGEPIIVGIDIGGTAVKLGAVAADGRILARDALPFRSLATFDALADALAASAAGLGRACGRPIGGVGVASPGVPHPETGIIVSGANNVPILRGHSIKAALVQRGLPARAAINDGIAAALGEHAHGAAAGLASFAMLTLGTGVGGCIVIDGKPVIGRDGHPPEIGALVLDRNGPPGPHGLLGTLEAYAAIAGFTAAHTQAGGAPDTAPETIFAAARQHDPVALASLDAVCRHLAQAIGGMINLLALDACLLGGGLSLAGEPLAAGVRRHLGEFTWPHLLAHAEIRLAATGNDAGVLGAAVAARRVG